MKVAEGKVVGVIGSLISVRFTGNIMHGEIAHVLMGEKRLKSEVLEISSNIAKLQVFESLQGVATGAQVIFTGRLLEVELGPGLLGSFFDGLQVPLHALYQKQGTIIQRGISELPLSREKKWDALITAHVNDIVVAGDSVGLVQEGKIKHKIFVPFAWEGKWKVQTIQNAKDISIDDPIMQVVNDEGETREITLRQYWSVKESLCFGKKVLADDWLKTGIRVIDGQFPLVKGGSFCTPGPFGAGKTILQHHLTKYSNVHIIIVVACGERAGEITQMLEELPQLQDDDGDPILNRTIFICNTSSMPVASREASIYMGLTIGEYYREMGYDILLLIDSTSRWAQALRELSGQLEEIPGDEAFPAYLSSRICQLYERAGKMNLPDGTSGSLTIGGTVSPAGGNFDEPVTQATLAVVGAFLGLSKDRADARRFPAIDPLLSWSRYVDTVINNLQTKNPHYSKFLEKSKEILSQGAIILQKVEVIGVDGVLPSEYEICCKSELLDFVFLQQNSFDVEDAFCDEDKLMTLMDTLIKVLYLESGYNDYEDLADVYKRIKSLMRQMLYMHKDSKDFQDQAEKINSIIEECIVASASQQL